MSNRSEPLLSTWLPLIALAASLGATTYLAQGWTQQKKYGPDLFANMRSGLCRHNDLLISRLPAEGAGLESWSILLHTLHEANSSVKVRDGLLKSDVPSWGNIYTQLVKIEDGIGSIPISRTTLITLLLLSNARFIHEFSDASGYRAALGSWCGQWYINWRVGKPATVTLRAHDSHSPATDVYPPVFFARVDACVRMMAGVVVHPSKGAPAFAVAFPGRMATGKYFLEHQANGFALSHGARHIYNMNGGKVFEVDFLLPRVQESRQPGHGDLELSLPNPEPKRSTRLYVPEKEKEILAKCMDYLPWTYLSWSMHWGMRDILLAFSSEPMQRYRQRLAKRLQQAPRQYRATLVKEGWNAPFVDKYMGDMASSAILAERGNSGDAVRIVTDLAALIHGRSLASLDETRFWRDNADHDIDEELDADTVAALVKCFVLEWSVEFDYQIYHRLPIDLVFT
jgi:hypothetical protein